MTPALCPDWSLLSPTASISSWVRATSRADRFPIGTGTGVCLSQGGNIYAAALLGLGIKDSTSGFRAYSARILRTIDLRAVRAEGYGFQIEMVRQVLDHGGRVVEVPIRFVDREVGESKMSMHIVVEALALVTWWAALRVVRALRPGGRARPSLTSTT
jgi:hypothetical protein